MAARMCGVIGRHDRERLQAAPKVELREPVAAR